MDLGDWILKTRKEQGQDIRSLAEKTGVDVGTISRIENSHTQATVITAFRLSEGLGTSLPNLIEALSGKPQTYQTSFDIENFEDDGSVLTLKDVKLLVDRFSSNDNDMVRNYLVNTLNRLIEGLLTYKPGFFDDEKPVHFNFDDVDKLLFRTRLYTFDLRYPLNLRPANIRYVYEHNGALMSSDIGSYLSEKRYEALSRPSSNMLLRMTGTGSLDRMKLSELISFDEELREDGRLMGLFWEVCRFEEVFNPPLRRLKYPTERSTLFEQSPLFENEEVEEVVTVRGKRSFEYRLARLYVIIYRWYQYLNRSGEILRFEKYL